MQEALACNSESGLPHIICCVFSRLSERKRVDGTMRGLGALESDSLTLWGWPEAKERMVPWRIR